MDFELDKKISRRIFLTAGSLAGLLFSPWQFENASATSSKEITFVDEDGYEAWLRYAVLLPPERESLSRLSGLIVDSNDNIAETTKIIHEELSRGLSKLADVKFGTSKNLEPSSIVVISGRTSQNAHLLTEKEFDDLGSEGYFIESKQIKDGLLTVIAGADEFAALRGTYAFLRRLQKADAVHNVLEVPTNPLRIIAHWDNADSGVERGYAGKSLWKWDELPDTVDPRLADYARLNASIGINGIVINNVNASPSVLSRESILKTAALAKVFRPYGIKVYCSINFASPCKLDNLLSADPLDQKVIEWWQKKAKEIYETIPDFGGFLVKANSEGVPGPQDYGRTHADGANMLAAALKPHGGIVMWRTFVYTMGNQDPDRVKRSYLEFKPLDGKFEDNVLIQIKTGPLDFQPREPFHPLFGALPKSRKLAELQITQEYMGQSTHLVYLASLWEEVLRSNTFGNGDQSMVAQIIEATPQAGAGGLAGGANTGSDRNWCGHHFAQANWYAFGRLAWNSNLTASDIATEWIKQTWSRKPEVVEKIRDIMLKSYEAYVSYTMPLGLHHMVGGDHYAPLPEGEGDPRGIFHHADAYGIGYDRTRKGSDAVDQYNPPLNDQFNDPKTCSEKFLLWFHHLPWDYKMPSGRILWEELCFKYDSGIKTARAMEKSWDELKLEIDAQRHAEVAAKLAKQAADAKAWSTHCLTYFGQYSKMQRVRF
ncbi:MAG: alpha-glucuronidase family glycosyl hydrolase [Candidatus Obscuribacterales bacterium]|nr:alpha-glucuronidase family glycosyl hydrolase [Candidatus Obscuribacterales bacterium]